MNASVVRALGRDAWYQVLDNWVFRILAWLTLLPILAFFVIGLREEGLVLCFGLKSWTYEELFGSFEGAKVLLENDPQGMLIEGVLSVVFELLAGSFGLLIALAATAAFVPQMLEKGAAELLFHRPVSRWVLFLSRYAAGLLFISGLSFLLVSGLYLGLRIASGHDDPGVLVAALSLTYVFGLIYSVSMLVGVVTRSTVAAMLLSILFFFFNGCVHNAWIIKEQKVTGNVARVAQDDEPEDEEATAPADPADASQKPVSGMTILGTLLDVVHAVLPKTTDADHLAKKLRAEIRPPVFRDEESLLQLSQLPSGIEPSEPPPASAELHGRLGQPLGAWSGEIAGAGRISYSLWRREAEKSVTHFGERTRERTETSSQAASTLQDLLEVAPGVSDLSRDSTRIGTRTSGGQMTASLVHWREASGAGSRTLEALVFRGVSSKHLTTLLVVVDGDPTPAALVAERARFTDKLGLDVVAADGWYASQLTFTAPWQYNTAFSIGSSLAFAALMLALGCWRLSRIAF